MLDRYSTPETRALDEIELTQSLIRLSGIENQDASGPSGDEIQREGLEAGYVHKGLVNFLVRSLWDGLRNGYRRWGEALEKEPETMIWGGNSPHDFWVQPSVIRAIILSHRTKSDNQQTLPDKQS